MIRVKIKGTGQVIDMIPAAAIAKINAGMAELVPEVEQRETFGGTLRRVFETASRRFTPAVR